MISHQEPRDPTARSSAVVRRWSRGAHRAGIASVGWPDRHLSIAKPNFSGDVFRRSYLLSTRRQASPNDPAVVWRNYSLYALFGQAFQPKIDLDHSPPIGLPAMVPARKRRQVQCSEFLRDSYGIRSKAWISNAASHYRASVFNTGDYSDVAFLCSVLRAALASCCILLRLHRDRRARADAKPFTWQCGRSTDEYGGKDVPSVQHTDWFEGQRACNPFVGYGCEVSEAAMKAAQDAAVKNSVPRFQMSPNCPSWRRRGDASFSLLPA